MGWSADVRTHHPRIGAPPMPTVVRDLMSAPPVTCEAGTSLADAARTMRDAGIGSVIVTERSKVAGILTERDLLRAAAAATSASAETVELWMTANPDVLGPDEEVDAAWTSLAHHQYRHLPVVDGHDLVGVVSLRDLMGVARLRPADEHGTEIPAGLEGVVAAETALGDVRGEEGFFHYRQYSAVDLAARRSLEDVWYLLLEGELPDADASRRFAHDVAARRGLPPGLAALLPEIATQGSPFEVLRTAVSLLGAELGWRPTHDITGAEVRAQTLRLCSVVPTMMAAAYNLGEGRAPVEPRTDLASAANYLWMVTGSEPTALYARAVEQYQILTIDHGFNASTFTARVITSTGADLAAAVCGAIGALSGPLHGGAPSRALAMLDDIGTAERADAWLRAAVDRGDRIMGFGHRVYKTDDPRSVFLRGVAQNLHAPLVDFACDV